VKLTKNKEYNCISVIQVDNSVNADKIVFDKTPLTCTSCLSSVAMKALYLIILQLKYRYSKAGSSCINNTIKESEREATLMGLLHWLCTRGD
jgi:hypothetical protein